MLTPVGDGGPDAGHDGGSDPWADCFGIGPCGPEATCLISTATQLCGCQPTDSGACVEVQLAQAPFCEPLNDGGSNYFDGGFAASCIGDPGCPAGCVPFPDDVRQVCACVCATCPPGLRDAG